MDTESDKMEKIVSLCKRRGFVFQGSEIYGGLKGTWDLGPLGVALNNNIKREWWKHFVDAREDMYGLDASIVMPEPVWQASGHLGAGFSDPLVEDVETGERYRADHLLTEAGVDADASTLESVSAQVKALQSAIADLEAKAEKEDDTHGKYSCETLLPSLLAVREAADALELVVADDEWPLPSYQEMLFIK